MFIFTFLLIEEEIKLKQNKVKKKRGRKQRIKKEKKKNIYEEPHNIEFTYHRTNGWARCN